MKKIIVLLGLFSFLIIKPINLISQETEKVTFCDSIIVNELKKNINEILSDSNNNYITDSLNWVDLANKRIYSKIIIRSSISIDSLINLVELDTQMKCVIKNYSYVFDYLISSGLDFKYDYFSRYEYSKNDNIYIDRLISKEYRDKKGLLDLYFKVYEHYRRYYFLNIKSDVIIKSLIKYGLYNFPSLTYNILVLHPPLNKDSFNAKMRNRKN